MGLRDQADRLEAKQAEIELAVRGPLQAVWKGHWEADPKDLEALPVNREPVQFLQERAVRLRAVQEPERVQVADPGQAEKQQEGLQVGFGYQQVQ